MFSRWMMLKTKYLLAARPLQFTRSRLRKRTESHWRLLLQWSRYVHHLSHLYCSPIHRVTRRPHLSNNFRNLNTPQRIMETARENESVLFEALNVNDEMLKALAKFEGLKKPPLLP